jgi:hypothetical protein
MTKISDSTVPFCGRDRRVGKAAPRSRPPGSVNHTLVPLCRRESGMSALRSEGSRVTSQGFLPLVQLDHCPEFTVGRNYESSIFQPERRRRVPGPGGGPWEA